MSELDYQSLVDYLHGKGWPICEAQVEAVQIKAKTTKITLLVEGDPDLHALADAAGGTVLLVVYTPLGKPGAGDEQADLFVVGQEDRSEKPPVNPAPAFDPTIELPPDDDLSRYEKPIPDEEEDGIFDEHPNKPPW